MAGFLDSLVERAQGGASSVRPLEAAVYGEAFEPAEIEEERVAEVAPEPPAKPQRRDAAPAHHARPAARRAPAEPDSAQEESPEDTVSPASPRRESRPTRPARRLAPAPETDAIEESTGEEGAATLDPVPVPRPQRGGGRRAAPGRDRSGRGPDAAAKVARPSPEPRSAVPAPRRRAPEAAPVALAAPGVRREVAAEPSREETVTVSIGRVEVRATTPPAPAAPVAPARPRQLLDDWLADYERGTGA